MVKKVNTLILFMGLFVASCSSVNQELDPKVFYVRDLAVKVNGVWTKGMTVVPKKSFYKLKIKSPGKMDLLLLESCHRQITLEGVGRKEPYTYIPIKGIEDQPNCSQLKISSFERGKKGRHAEAVIIIENEKFALPARVKCNGKENIYNGTSSCHARQHLYQVVEFDVPVKIYETKCSMESPNNVSRIRFPIHSRDCRFIFKDKKNRKHIMYTSGYEEVLIRD